MKPKHEYKYFTMRISVKLHTEVKRFCAEYQISMKTFSEEAYIRHLMFLEEKIDEKKAIKSLSTFSDLDS